MDMSLRWVSCLTLLCSAISAAAPDFWVLKLVVRPPVPAGLTTSTNPIDAFIAAEYKTKGLRAAGPADRRTLLRRLYLDLVGIPPTPAEQDAFLDDPSPGAYEK